jgi:nicotinamidase-related amidase
MVGADQPFGVAPLCRMPNHENGRESPRAIDHESRCPCLRNDTRGVCHQGERSAPDLPLGAPEFLLIASLFSAQVLRRSREDDYVGQRDLHGLGTEQILVVLVDLQVDFCANDAANATVAMKANDFASRAQALGVGLLYVVTDPSPARLTDRQRPWVPGSVCAPGSPGAALFVDRLPGSSVARKALFDMWQSMEVLAAIEDHRAEGLVIAGVNLHCCVLFAVLGAWERGYRYAVPPDLVSGHDQGEASYNQAVRSYLALAHHQEHSSLDLLATWQMAREPSDPSAG